MNRRLFFRFIAAAPIAIAAAPALARSPRLTGVGECGPWAIIPLTRKTLSQLRVSAEMDCDAYIRAVIAKSNDVILMGLRDPRNRTGI